MTLTNSANETGTNGLDAGEGTGWRASLRLRLAGRDDRTRLVGRSHVGPLVVQRPFYPEDDGRCHLYVVHPPGGIVGGDRLEIAVDVIEEGQVLMTTPSATKIYRSAGATAVIEQRFRVEEGAALEWLPQETIAFDGSRSRIDTTIDLEDGAVFIGWDTLCLGRPAAAEAFESGRLTQRLRLRRNGRMLVEERLGLRGAGAELEAAWGLQGSSVLATMVVADTGGDASHVVRSVRDALPEGLGLAGVTAISGVLVCRVLADSARVARVLIHAAWGAVRPEVLQRAAIPPRIWAT